MEFLDPNLSKYAEDHTKPESELLSELNRKTWTDVMQPRMLSGHLQGRVLSLFSHMLKPKHILEIGTYTGYSALCLAEGLDYGGMLDTIDVNEELKPMVKSYFDRSPYAEQIRFHLGKAAEIIPTIEGRFDLVFIDADKENYSNYFDLVIDRLMPGGIIIADNVLWSGKVLDQKELAKDKDTMALDAFNKKVQADDRVENVLLPIRDGLMVVRKR